MTGLLYLVEFVFTSTKKRKKKDTQISKMAKFLCILLSAVYHSVPTAHLLPRRFAIWHFGLCVCVCDDPGKRTRRIFPV